jgi:hypothetical protein
MDLVHVGAALAVQMVVILGACRLSGWLVGRLLRQPRVIGDMIAGILLGPSLLGWLAPQAQALLFPIETRPLLQFVAQAGIGLIIIIFCAEARGEAGRIEAGEVEAGESRTIAIDVRRAGRVAPVEVGHALAIARGAKGIESDGIGKIIMGVHARPHRPQVGLAPALHRTGHVQIGIGRLEIRDQILDRLFRRRVGMVRVKGDFTGKRGGRQQDCTQSDRAQAFEKGHVFLPMTVMHCICRA